MISGLTTAVQARKVGRIGAGYILVMGSTSPFLAVSVTAIERGGPGDLEFIATTDASNIEDQLAMLSEATASVPVETETPLRLLRHYASSIRHQQYHDIDILTIRVDAVGRTGQVGWD